MNHRAGYAERMNQLEKAHIKALEKIHHLETALRVL